jgi:hypothetical protein
MRKNLSGIKICIFSVPTLSGINVYLARYSLPIAVAQWLRYCAKNRKVAGSIPDGIIGIFH